MIELCDHYEYFSDNEGEIGDNNDDDAKKTLDIEIPADETQGGYASEPENIDHAIFPQLDTTPQQPLIIGKKRRR